MKWPSLAAHSRASVAEALATVTPALTQSDARDRPDPRELRTVLYQHAFNPAHPAGLGSAAAQILDWAQQASLPVDCLSEPAVLRTALEALTFRLDGSRAAANTIIRKRAVLHGALGYAAETGLLPDNPLDSFGWQVPQSSAALNPAVVASSAQVRALLDATARNWPEMTAFFGCLYYAALRPEEAVALGLPDCDLPGSGWGILRLATVTTRTAAAWTSSGTSHEQRGLKHRPDGAIRMVPVPPVLAAMLRAHVTAYGTAPEADGSTEPAAGRSADRSTAGPGNRPHHRPRSRASRYRARPAPLRPAPRRLVTVAERRRGPGPDRGPGRTQHRGPAHRLQPLHPRPRRPPQRGDRPRPRALRMIWSVPVRGKPAVTPDRATPRKPAVAPTARLRERRAVAPTAMGADVVRDTSVTSPPRPADGPQTTSAPNGHSHPGDSHLRCSKAILEQYANSNELPDPAHGWPKTLHQRSANRSLGHAKAGSSLVSPAPQQAPRGSHTNATAADCDTRRLPS